MTTKRDRIVEYLERSQLLEFLIISFALAISLTFLTFGLVPLRTGEPLSLPLLLIGGIVIILAATALIVVIQKRKNRAKKEIEQKS
ncbi:MAG: hypothetical protein K9W42_13025 [Candidatus Heimdallarchaeota archaeon]|nr:hypothetical protein [Candidatus Heimdallarchaeota archaeon]